MLYLERGRLKVHVLDMVADRARLGTRYCTAGSVFQVEDLERTLTLAGRTLRVETRIANAGKRLVPFPWYPHSSWPVNPTGECCRFSVPVTLPGGFLCTKAAPPARGWFLWVGTAADRPMEILQRHLLLGLVAAWTDYVPARLPVWGNTRTFSFEPYCEPVVNPGAETRWSISYAV